MRDLQPIIAEIRDQLMNHIHPERIILFGSYAKETEKLYSDIDILIVTKSPVPLSQQTLSRDLFYDYPVNVDVLFCTDNELLSELNRRYSFLNAIMKNCVTLYELNDTHGVV